MDVRKPDVRFFYQDENMSGFRHFRFSDVRFILVHTIISGFRTFYIYKTSENRTLYPVLRRYIYNVWKPDITSGFQTFQRFWRLNRPKPVPNRFQTGFGRFGPKRPITGRPVHIMHWNRTSEIRTIQQPEGFRKTRKPNVRISDHYCILKKNAVFGFQCN